MRYMPPITGDKSTTLNDVTHTVKYYEEPLSITGVTNESYLEYDNTATYGIGDYVLLDDLKKYYRCAADGTTGKHPLENTDLWVDFGPINTFRMLASDEFINNKTTGTDCVIVIDFSRKDTFAFVDADFIEVIITLVDNDTGQTLFNKEYKGRDYGSLNYSDFYYQEYKVLSRLVVDGMEWLPDATLTLTFTGGVSIGGLVSGNSSDLGVTLMGTSLKFEDTSKVSVSPITGTRSVLRYGNVRVIDCKLLMETDQFNIIANRIDAIIGKNILWIPSSDDIFAELISIGYIEDFTLPIDSPRNVLTNAVVVGVL